MDATRVTNAVDPVSESRIVPETGHARTAQPVTTAASASYIKEDTKESSSSKVSSEEIAQVIAEDMNEVARVLNTSLNFSVDKPTGRTVIKVIDRETEETIRQIPPEDMLKLMRKMKNMMGMLLDIEV